MLTGVGGGVQGTLNSLANSSFTIQFYANQACDASGNGEGRDVPRCGARVNTDANGNAAIPLFAARVGQIVTATATSRGRRHVRVLARA